MSPNRKQRRTAASHRRKQHTSKNGAADVVLAPPQRRRISQAYADCVAVERRLATLDLERDAIIGLVRQRRMDLQQECVNALRGQGLDVDDPSIHWVVNPETMEVERQVRESAPAPEDASAL